MTSHHRVADAESLRKLAFGSRAGERRRGVAREADPGDPAARRRTELGRTSADGWKNQLTATAISDS